MDSVLKTVQRYLYIGNDVPFFLHTPHTPLNVELGKKVLAPAVNLPDQVCPKGTETPPETAQSKKKQKKAKAKAAQAAEKAAAQAAEKAATQATEKQAIRVPKDEASQASKKDVVEATEKGAVQVAETKVKPEAAKESVPEDKKEPAQEAGKEATETNPTIPETEAKSDETAAHPVQSAKIQPVPLVLGLIKTVMKAKALRRTDECLFALAYCAREFATDEERQAVYAIVPELVNSSRDFFHFLAYYMQLATQSGHAGFGHGMRQAITKWYDKHTAMQLAEMLVTSCKSGGWTHKDVFAKAHLKLSCPEKQSLIDAATKRTSQLNAGKPTEKKKGRKGKKHNAVVASTAETVPNASEALERYQTMRQFRSATTKSVAMRLIKQHGMTLDMMPPHFKRSTKVWEALYPTMSYRELLAAALPMQDFRLLTLDGANGKAYAAALENRLSALEEEQIHPIDVQNFAMMFDKSRRYEGIIKETVHRINRPTVGHHHEVLKNLQRAVEHSLSHHPKTGVRYYIALDLRKPHETKNVFRSEIVSCLHASVMLAFSIFKREKNVTVVAFTEQKGILKPVQFTTTMTWPEALNHCREMLEPKTKVCLAAPIEQAEANKLKVDVFITITDSLIRVNPTRSPPCKALRDYRKKIKLNLSRYIAISLSGHKPSFDFGGSPDGILEVAGYNATNAKIIEAFAKNFFI